MSWRGSAASTSPEGRSTGLPLASSKRIMLNSGSSGSVNQRRIASGGSIRMALAGGSERSRLACASAGATHTSNTAIRTARPNAERRIFYSTRSYSNKTHGHAGTDEQRNLLGRDEMSLPVNPSPERAIPERDWHCTTSFSPRRVAPQALPAGTEFALRAHSGGSQYPPRVAQGTADRFAVQQY